MKDKLEPFGVLLNNVSEIQDINSEDRAIFYKMLLLTYGHNHAARGVTSSEYKKFAPTNLFVDMYQRESENFSLNDYFLLTQYQVADINYHGTSSIDPSPQSNSQTNVGSFALKVPKDSLSIKAYMKHQNRTNSSRTIKINSTINTEFDYLVVTQEYPVSIRNDEKESYLNKVVSKTIENLGHMGALNSRDTSLYDAANGFLQIAKYQNMNFIGLVKHMFTYRHTCSIKDPKERQKVSEQIKENFNKRYKNISVKISKQAKNENWSNLKEAVLSSIKKEKQALLLKNKTNNKQSLSSKFFYLDALEKLLSEFNIKNGLESSNLAAVKDILQQSKCSLIRMQRLIVDLSKEDISFHKFMRQIEYCFDEIALQKFITDECTVEHTQKVVKKFLTECQQGEPPTSVEICNSGMDAISKSLLSAMEQLKENGLQLCNVYFLPGSYYEMREILWHLAPLIAKKEEEKNSMKLTYYISDLKYTGITNKDDKVIDIIFGNSIDNIDARVPSNKYHDISHVIQEQLELRQKDNVKNRPLIMSIDTTSMSLDDPTIEGLLLEYKDEITSGKLILMCTHSLNKYFSLGLGKAPGGILYSYHSSQFKKLNELNQRSQSNKSKNLLGGQLFGPALIQMTQLMEIIPEKIHNYFFEIKRRSVLLNYLTQSVLDAKNDDLIQIDTGVVKETIVPIGKSESVETGYKYSWSFVPFRFRYKFLGQGPFSFGLGKKIYNELALIADELEIFFRDGYGFCHTTNTSILAGTSEPIFRISVGMEDEEDLKLKFEVMAKFSKKVNELVREYNQNPSFASSINLQYQLLSDISDVKQSLLSKYKHNQLSSINTNMPTKKTTFFNNQTNTTPVIKEKEAPNLSYTNN